MKKALLFGGIGLAGFGLYRYFKSQVDLALNYDYKIKNFKILGYDNDNINVSLELEIVNNSSFEILVKEYDLKISFKGKNIANSKNNVPFAVLPNNSFTLKTDGVINIKESKVAILPFVKDVLAKNPINVEVSGFVKVKFLGINYTINFNNESFQYSADLLKDVGLGKKVNNFKTKNPAIAKFLGIK
jgi:LEA14-like dessication related protein